MQQLNYDVDNDLLEPEIVADSGFLQDNRYFSEEGGK